MIADVSRSDSPHQHAVAHRILAVAHRILVVTHAARRVYAARRAHKLPHSPNQESSGQ